MQHHGRIVMIAREAKGELAVTDQRKLLPFGVMHGV